MALGSGLVIVSSLIACGGDDDSGDESTSLNATAATIAASAEASADFLDDGATPAAAEEPGAADTLTNGAQTNGAQPNDFDFGSVGRDVIVEMYVSMHSDDLARTVASISAQASALGGGIASSNIDYGTVAPPSPDAPDTTGQISGAQISGGHAVMVVKLPPEAVERLLDGLADSGSVISINQSATDVTDQLVDLDVRIANARTSVENVRGFMEQTTNLTELVSLEGELTRRQTELEQLEAQQRNLADRVALSTITIEVRPTPVEANAAAGSEPDDGIVDAFRTGWEAFVAVVFGVAFILAVLAPFIALGFVVLALAWLITRRTNRVVPSPAVTLPEPDQAPVEQDA
ncbi:MAG TPA: DUF4349 domain-containing protein [Ilumatobacter sp.]|nr:DUF4349 domain-containing protein [Ilumatobacter sp.]